MRLSQWLARFLTPDTKVATGRVRRRSAATAPSLYVRRLEDRRVLSVDVVDGQSFTIAENSANGTSVGTVQVTQSTPTQALTYSITAGNTGNAFSINSTTGQISVATSAALDFETTPTFNLSIRATTATNGSDTSTVVVNLSNVAEARTLTLTGPAATMSLVGNNILVTQNGVVVFNEAKAFTTSLTINGMTTVNTLTLDLTGGNPIPTGGLIYDGLGPTTTPGDALIINGGSFDTAVYTFTNAHDGTIALTASGVTSTITYRNLEPVSNSGTATSIQLVLSSVDDNAVLEDVGGGQLRLRSFNGASPTFEATTFTAPTGSLTVNGGAGNDTITVTPLSGSFALSVDGGAGTNTLVVDQINPAVASSNEFRFAGYTFDQTNTPDQLTLFTSGQTPSGQTEVTINSAVGSATASANFPSTLFGFNSALTIGRLANLTLTSGTLALNMPSGNDGTTRRSGFELSWSSGRTLSNQAGDDFVIYEASSTVGTQDAAMISVHVVGGGWTQWYYEPKDTRESYPGSGEGAYATAIDLSNLGLASGAQIDKIRYVNMIAADRMVGPGYEKVVGSGLLFATGFVVPGGVGSSVLPDPGDNANYNYFGSTTLDPDPLYFGVLHPLNAASSAGPGNDTIAVTGTSVAVTVDGTAKVSVGYTSMSTLRVTTRAGDDAINVSLQSTLPATIALDGGDGTDLVTLTGTTGAQTIVLAGAQAKVDGKTITMSRVEDLVVDTQAAGAGDTVTVDGSFHLSGGAPTLNIVGGGAATQNDQLLVSRAPQLYTVGSVTFDQAATPNVYSDLPLMALDGGHGVVVNTTPDKTTSGTSSLPTGFPSSAAGFDYSLSLGALVARDTAPTTPRFFGLPDLAGNGTTRRSGFSLSWTDDRVMANAAGTSEFVFYESGSAGVPESIMVQVHNSVTGVWSDWIYKPATSTSTTSAGVAFATVYDLSDFGLAIGDTVDAIRAVNLIDADRMQDSSGFGVVLPGETSPTSTTRPRPGPQAPSLTQFPTSSLDPDPIYFGSLHGTTYDVSIDPDSVDVTGAMSVGYQGLAKVTVETGGDSDTLTVTPSTETEYVIKGGFPLISTNPGDEAALVLTGVTDPTFNVGTVDASGHTTGTLVSASHKQVSFSGIDRFTADTPMDVVVDATANNAAGTDTFLVDRNVDDGEITVNGKLVFRAELTAIDHLQVNGSTDIDKLTVERANGDPVPGGGITFAAGLGDDKLTVQGDTATDLKHTIAGALAGEIDLDGSLIDYTGTETVVDKVTATNREFQFADVADTIDLEDYVDADFMIFSGATTPDIQYKNPTESLTVNLGDGDDLFTVVSVDAGFNASLEIDGEAGDDEVTIDVALALGSAAAKGDLKITAERVNLNKSIDTTGSTLAGSVGNVTLSVSDLLAIAADGDITATGDVLIDGGGDVETQGDITSNLGDITIDDAVVLMSDDVNFTALAGDATFGSTVDSETGEFYKLVVEAKLGTVTFDDAVGSADPLGSVQIDAQLVNVNGVIYSEVSAGTGGAITIHADEVELNSGGGLDVGDGSVTIVTLTDGVELVLGDDDVGNLGLDEDEVQRIVAGLFLFGDARSGAITLVNTSTFYGSVDTLHLTTGAGISGDGVIDIENLALTSVDDIALTGSQLVDALAAEVSASGAGITFTDDVDLFIATIDNVAGITTNGGLTELIIGLGLELGQDPGAPITSKYLRLAGTGALYFLDETTNDVDVLTAALDGGDLYYLDADDLAIGDASSTEGITTNDGSLEIDTGDTLSVYRPIDAGAGAVLFLSLGAIEDTGPTGAKVIADSLDFGAVDGIGNTTPFETSVAHLSGGNLSTGTISIKDTSGALLSVDYLGLTNLADGGITLTHTGGLKITSEVLSMGGGIAFTSIANGGGDDDLNVEARLRNLGGTGDIVLTAGDDLTVFDTTFNTDIRNSGSGSIIGTAGGVVTLMSSVIIRSATGAITDIPPLLFNVAAPQIANTGAASVSFDYGRLNEFNFTALVDWADGFTDLLTLGNPGSSGANHVYNGNPNFVDPAAPIPISVTLRADARIRFTGYETTTITVLADFPGDGVRNVRIDTTAKVPHLVAPPPTRITDIPQSVVPVSVRNQVTGGAGLVAGAEKSAERILILREVLPSGREGTEMQFNQAMLNRLDEIYAKLRNGRYRLYLYEPDEQKLRKVLDVYIKDGKPAAAEDAREQRQDRPDGASLPPPESSLESVAAEAGDETDDEDAAAPPSSRAAAPSLAAGSLTLGAGLVVTSSQPWHERVDAALAKFRRYSPLRSRPTTRRTPR